MAAGEADKPGADLSAYLDGELPAEQARRVERQLEQSDDCRQTVEQLREVSDLLASMPRHNAPEELTRDLALPGRTPGTAGGNATGGVAGAS